MQHSLIPSFPHYHLIIGYQPFLYYRLFNQVKGVLLRANIAWLIIIGDAAPYASE